jgi:hypothetical protein
VQHVEIRHQLDRIFEKADRIVGSPGIYIDPPFDRADKWRQRIDFTSDPQLVERLIEATLILEIDSIDVSRRTVRRLELDRFAEFALS